jgi:CBS-domain-containing membrane protein
LAQDSFDARGATARDVMTPGIHCCREDDDLAKAVRHMEALKIRRLPVINKSKRMIGILSLSGRRQPFGVREGYAAGEASRRPNFVMRFHVNPSF